MNKLFREKVHLPFFLDERNAQLVFFLSFCRTVPSGSIKFRAPFDTFLDKPTERQAVEFHGIHDTWSTIADIINNKLDIDETEVENMLESTQFYSILRSQSRTETLFTKKTTKQRFALFTACQSIRCKDILTETAFKENFKLLSSHLDALLFYCNNNDAKNKDQQQTRPFFELQLNILQ